VFLERFSPGGRRKGGGCSLRSSLGGPSSFKDLPSSRVLLVIRRHHYHPFSLVKGGWRGSSFSQLKRHGSYRGW